jgi:hypothetical protein
MLNIFNKKQKNYNDKSLNTNDKSLNNTNSINIYENFKIVNKVDQNEYKNLIFYPSSTKEWFNSVYSYNKTYIKSLIAIDAIVNNVFTNYFNMLQNRIKILYKRRKNNKTRYSANKIYLSRTETKYTNTKVVILLHVYNKQKASVERYLKQHINLTTTKEYRVGNKILKKLMQKNRLTHILKKKFSIFKKFNIAFVKKMDTILKGIASNVRSKLNLYEMPIYYTRLFKKLYKLQTLIFNAVDLINFNMSKFNNLVIN